jgi:hypothetical protein
MNDDVANHFRRADRELQRDDGATARPEYDGRRSTDMPKQRGRIVGVLLERSGTSWLAP